jgi:hypothetical protein
VAPIKIVDQPILPVSERERRAIEQKVWDYCVMDGRNCRRIGIPLRDCPAFQNNDMTVSWRMGWRQQDEWMKERKQRRTDRGS